MNWRLLSSLVVTALSSAAMADITTEIYRIHSGDHVTIGGIAGSMTNELPTASQVFLKFEYDFAQGTAVMQILAEDFETEFLTLSNGRIVGGQILFSNIVQHPLFPIATQPASLEYKVQLGNASVWVDGSIIARPECCDIPYAFLHVGLHATILPGPPSTPVGLYDYLGYDHHGTLIVRGHVLISSRVNPIEGSWRLTGVDDPMGIGPQIGRGQLRGALEGNGLILDLNPGYADNNVILNGVLSHDSFSGGWSYSTILGPVTNGTFVAAKKHIRLLRPRWESGQFVFSCDVDKGVRYVVERSESVSRDGWRELFHSTGTGDIQHHTHSDAPIGGRFYRLGIVGLAEGESMEDCAVKLLATHFDLSEDDISLVSVEERVFSNSCCDCAVPNMFCAEIISPGHRLMLQAGGARYEVRTCGGVMILCDRGRGVVLGTCE